VQLDGIQNGTAAIEPLNVISWQVTFPELNDGNIDLEPDQSGELLPGAYGDVSVKSRSTLTLHAGTYFFHSLSLEPQAVLKVTNTGSPVFIYMQSSFAFSGNVQPVDTVHMNVLFGYAGTSTVAIQTPFWGVLVAPNASVTLPTTSDEHIGAFFAQSLTAHQNTRIVQQPFDPANFCTLGSACSGVCPCTGGQGTCHSNSDCAAGLSCNASGICVQPQCISDPHALGCTCATSADCTGGAVCTQGGTCGNLNDPCSTSAQCPVDSFCAFKNGADFGLDPGTSVCIPTICSSLDPTVNPCKQPGCVFQPDPISVPTAFDH
jgi:hypothetical protein